MPVSEMQEMPSNPVPEVVRAFIAEDNPQVRASLRVFLELHLKLQVVGEAAEVQELVEAVALSRPSLLLLAWELPDQDCRGLIRRIKSCCPGVKIVSLSSQSGMEQAVLQAGADAFVYKGDPPECLIAALSEVIS